jgi:catechol 2,3-dioxygenase-like lactoylglutathione lyase family enzyme
MMAIDNTFDHTGFVTRDIERTVAFWTDVVGLEAGPIVERNGDWIGTFTGVSDARLKIVHLFGPGVHLEFLEFTGGGSSSDVPPAANAACTGHVCLRVDDPAAALERCLSAGAAPAGRVSTITEGAAAGLTGVYLRDPNGLLVELLQRA